MSGGHGEGAVGGKRVCLKAGQKCVLRFNGQYRRYGFDCKTGRLTRRSRWVITDLGTLGGRQSWAIGINERGQIVGRADTRVVDGVGGEHTFLWQNGKMRDIDPLGDPVSEAQRSRSTSPARSS